VVTRVGTRNRKVGAKATPNPARPYYTFETVNRILESADGTTPAAENLNAKGNAAIGAMVWVRPESMHVRTSLVNAICTSVRAFERNAGRPTVAPLNRRLAY
jgi:hypothetical protein